MRIGSLEDLYREPGLPSASTMRRIIRLRPDFPFIRAGARGCPYTLRHTGAVWAAEAGVSMAELAQFMGHDDDRTTQKHYARFSPDHLRGVANAIGRRV